MILNTRRNYKGLDMLAGEIHNNFSDDDVDIFLKMYVLLYADDTIVMVETPEDLHSALNAACDYCQTWHLTVNISKTKVIISHVERSNHTQTSYLDKIN